ncbi:hypothetical protein [Nocardia uniformis]|uniref:hypothetical protein n=1 Tax=Nocardia uniformis TaxID=53432 RepID=UPI000834BC53|nr:hypothetical protein [Nocardia uniformis]
MSLLSHAQNRAALSGLAAALVAAAALAGCGADSESSAPQPDLTSVPAGLHWNSFQGIAIPAGEDGPTTNGVTATGYRQTPQGAALAAIAHTVRLSTADNTSWAHITAAEVAPGPARDAWTLARARVKIAQPADPATAPRILGYQITSYQPERATVNAVSAYPDKSLAATAIAVVWQRGDWRLELPDPASTTPTVSAITSVPTDGFVRLEGTQ